MNKTFIKIGLCLLAVCIIGFLLYRFLPIQNEQKTTELNNTKSITQKYTNEKYNFGLMIPEDFSVREMSNGDTIVFENKNNEGIQIVVSPSDDIKILTKEMIEKDIPDLLITDAQTVEIGDNYKGLAFKSDNSAFGGASREVWFVFRNNLYQISTYEKFDELLKKVFSTWVFL